MKFSTKLDLLIALVLAYALTCLTKGTELLSMYTLLNTQALLTTFCLIFLVIVLLGITVRQFYAQRKRLTAALTLKRQPKLHQHITSGVGEGSFAYLNTMTEYGPENFLLPLTVVYVVSDLNDGNVIVVPKFGARDQSLVGADKKESPWAEDFTFPITVPKSHLLKHVPLHMIPEII